MRQLRQFLESSLAPGKNRQRRRRSVTDICLWQAPQSLKLTGYLENISKVHWEQNAQQNVKKSGQVVTELTLPDPHCWRKKK